VPYTEHSRLCVREWLAFRSALKPTHEMPWLRLLPFDLTPQGSIPLRRSLTILDPTTAPLEIRWHRLRHTFATELLRAGMPLEKLQVMMGHATLQQTLAYAEIVNADVISEAERTADEFARNLGLAEPEMEVA
jgi:site-specific recombinase XerD